MKKESVKLKARFKGGNWYVWSKGEFPGPDYSVDKKLGSAYSKWMVKEGYWRVYY